MEVVCVSRRAYIMVAAIALLVMAFPAMATNVSISSVTADLAFSKDYGAVTQGNTLTITLNLPFTLNQINSTGGADYLNITAEATKSTTVNVTVNGVAVLTNYVISAGTTKQITFGDMATAGVNMSATQLTIAVKAVANNTTADLLVMNADNAAVSANWSYTVKESRLSTPNVVKFGSGQSFYAVKDTVTVTQNSDVNVTNFTATFSYPSNALSTSISSYNFGTLNTSQSKSVAISYQKQGPVVSTVKVNETDTKVNVTMTIYSSEAVTADFALNPGDKEWSSYFPDFDINNIEKITLNGVKHSYGKSNGEILMSLDLSSGNNNLKIVYTKTTAAVAAVTPTATPTPQWYEVPQNQILLLLAAGLVIGAVIVSRRR